MNLIWIMSATSALALSACSVNPADRASTPAVSVNNNVAAAADQTSEEPMANNSVSRPPETSANRRPSSGDKILPAPVQPPAEVDPAHRYPGDTVEPAPPPPPPTNTPS